MSDLLNLFQGRPVDLLPFNEVKEVLRLRQVVDRGIQEIPLDRIVGTVDASTNLTGHSYREMNLFAIAGTK